MSQKALRLTESLYNTPHLISLPAFDGIMSYLDSRNNGTSASVDTTPTISASTTRYDASTKVGRLNVNGALTDRSNVLTALCGITSYQQLQSDFDQMVTQGARTIVVWIDSGGGQAYGAFETASYLRKIADEKGIRLVAYCDGTMASAAYALGSVAHEVALNPESECGSIGVVVKLRNISQQLKNAGVEDTYLIGGADKVPFANDGSWRTEFIADIQSKVNFLYGQFTSFVAKHRDISLGSVVDTQAKMFTAKDAVKLGLADSTMTREAFESYISSGRTMKVTNAIRQTMQPAANAPKRSLAASKAGAMPTATTSKDRPLDRQSRIPKGFSGVAQELILKSTKNLSDAEFSAHLAKLEKEWIGSSAA